MLEARIGIVELPLLKTRTRNKTRQELKLKKSKINCLYVIYNYPNPELRQMPKYTS